MATSPAATPLTFVVVDNGSPVDLKRLLQQVVKTAPRDAEVVLASLRPLRLPATLARRVRRLRGLTAEDMDAAVLLEATHPRLVVVASSASRVSAGWLDEVVQRSLIYRDVISSLDAPGGGVLLYPPAVVSVSALTVPWMHTRYVNARGHAASDTAETTVSAVLIVKDEEDVLGTCLSAVSDFVDEIVVYDTGSTDGTMDIARAHGAKVVEGYWDDHFGNARNRALAHATGEWVLQVDADEVIEGDPLELRTRLAGETADQVHVKIVSSAWQGVRSGLETLPVRIFRRGTAQWFGALHEYPRPADGSEPTISHIPAPARLIHSGYELAKVIDRRKTLRNIDLSRRELDAAPSDSPVRGELLSNLIRSLLWANDVAQALPYFDELLVTEGNPTALCMTGRPAVDIMSDLNRPEAALAWIEKLHALGESSGNVAVMRARLHVRGGHTDAAREALAPFLEGKDGGRDPWGVPFDTAQLRLLLADITLQEGDTAGAIELYLDLLPASSALLNLNTVLTAFVQIGRRLHDLADRAPEELLARSIREASTYHPSGALAWFEACVETHPGDVRFVVAGNVFAARADWQTALSWAVRAREWDLEDVCALRGLGLNESMPPMERAMAWLVLTEALGEDDASEQLSNVLEGLESVDLTVLRSVAQSHGLSGDLVDRPVDLGAAEKVTTS